MNETERLTENSDSIFREEEDGAFLFDPETGNLKYINAMGVTLYRLCDGIMTVGDITSLVIENYKDIANDQIKTEVSYFLKSLVDMNFLKKGKSV